jgi:hypothetical protein
MLLSHGTLWIENRRNAIGIKPIVVFDDALRSFLTSALAKGKGLGDGP